MYIVFLLHRFYHFTDESHRKTLREHHRDITKDKNWKKLGGGLVKYIRLCYCKFHTTLPCSLSSPVLQGHVSYCQLLVLSSFTIIKTLLLRPIKAKLGINVPSSILYRTDVGIFDLSKNMAKPYYLNKTQNIGIRQYFFFIYLQNRWV